MMVRQGLSKEELLEEPGVKGRVWWVVPRDTASSEKPNLPWSKGWHRIENRVATRGTRPRSKVNYTT